MKYFFRILTVLSLIMIIPAGCKKENTVAIPSGGTTLSPKNNSENDTNKEQKISKTEQNSYLPLVSPGENYNVQNILDINLDDDTTDEQIILAMPLEKPESVLELMIISTSGSQKNQYEIVWKKSLITRTLTNTVLETDDLTGNGRKEIIVSGFDKNGRHITQIFGVPKYGKITNYTNIFSMVVKGNIDIIKTERSSLYYSGRNSGEPYRITVQQQDPESDNMLDIIESEWIWNPKTFKYEKSNVKKIKAEKILGDKIKKVYSGNVEVFENYLKGAWYKESGGNSDNVSMVFFDPDNREIIFYNRSIEELFDWGTSHRTTAKRLYTKILNDVVSSIYEILSISAESWDKIELKRTSSDWDGTYRRLDESMQLIKDANSTLPSLLKELPLNGLWSSPDGSELFFDMPEISWTENGKTRSGTASLFSLNNQLILQILFTKPNGDFEETGNWLINYEEDKNENRIIRSLSLQPVILTVESVKPSGRERINFEQIEILSSDSTEGTDEITVNKDSE